MGLTLKESIGSVNEVCDVRFELLLSFARLYFAHECIVFRGKLLDVGVTGLDDWRALKLVRYLIQVALQQLNMVIRRQVLLCKQSQQQLTLRDNGVMMGIRSRRATNLVVYVLGAPLWYCIVGQMLLELHAAVVCAVYIQVHVSQTIISC